MMRNEEILKQLEAGVLAEKPGTNEHKIAMDALSKYLATCSEIEKTESELRMKQNSMDDELKTTEVELGLKTNELELKTQQFEYQKEKDAKDAVAEEKRSKWNGIWEGVKTGLSVLTLGINTILAVEILKENYDGKPLLSNPGRALSNSILFKEKKR